MYRSSALSRFAPVLLVGWLLAACSTVPVPVADETLETRLDAYYQAVVARDFRSAYSFFMPGYREQVRFEHHYQKYPPVIRHVDAQFVSKECVTENACKVQVRVKVLLPDEPGEAKDHPVTTVAPERWVRVDGQWWRVPPR